MRAAGHRPFAVGLPRLEPLLEALPEGPLSPEHIQGERTLLAREGPLEVHYAPFEHVPRQARLVVLGITPGLSQARRAWETARDAYRAGAPRDEVMRRAIAAARFFGRTRQELVAMLDAIGVADALLVPTTGALFDADDRRLYTSSAVRFPAFVRGRSSARRCEAPEPAKKNYTGHAPPLSRSPLLLSFVERFCAPVLEEMPGALVVPLGRAVEDVVARVVRERQIPSEVLRGFPHPSPANGHRHRQLQAHLPGLRAQVAAWGS